MSCKTYYTRYMVDHVQYMLDYRAGTHVEVEYECVRVRCSCDVNDAVMDMEHK